jgi:hypothetical protein
MMIILPDNAPAAVQNRPALAFAEGHRDKLRLFGKRGLFYRAAAIGAASSARELFTVRG